MARLRDLARLLRPSQFIKNGFVAMPLFFGQKLTDPAAVLATLITFAAFCLAAGAVYILNDLMDINEDQAHPVKRLRPLASGAVDRVSALRVMAGCSLGSLGLGLSVNVEVAAILAGYLLMNVLYSVWLKHVAILDISIIGLGFVFRLMAGAWAGEVPLSKWIVLVTFLLALFLALAKRRDDLLLAARQGAAVRKSLDGYNLEMVSAAMVIMAAVTIVGYILYTVSPEVVAAYSTQNLYLTAFWVILGVLRYLQIAFVFEKSGSPTQVFLTDAWLKLITLGWLATFFIIIYLEA